MFNGTCYLLSHDKETWVGAMVRISNPLWKSNLSQIELLTHISMTGPFPILGVLVEFFHLHLNRKLCKKIMQANSEDPYQAPHFDVSDLGLHGLQMFHKNARLVC